MDEQAQTVDIRRRRSRAEAEQLVAAYEASGMDRVEFCRQHGLSLSTLARYRERQREAQGAPANGSQWLAVEVTGASEAAGSGDCSGLAVSLARGRRIEVGRGFDAHTLAQLLDVLERL
jgi:hypothetical protein